MEGCSLCKRRYDAFAVASPCYLLLTPHLVASILAFASLFAGSATKSVEIEVPVKSDGNFLANMLAKKKEEKGE